MTPEAFGPITASGKTKRTVAPSDLQGAAHPALWQFVLQVVGQQISCSLAWVNHHANGQQLAAQIITPAAQHIHRHCPFPPAPQGIFETQQAAKVDFLPIKGNCVDVHR
jgi:hypothetical protein